MDMFSPARVTQVCNTFGLLGGISLDLTIGWDLSKASDRENALRKVYEDEPGIIIGSPPCT